MWGGASDIIPRELMWPGYLWHDHNARICTCDSRGHPGGHRSHPVACAHCRNIPGVSSRAFEGEFSLSILKEPRNKATYSHVPRSRTGNQQTYGLRSQSPHVTKAVYHLMHIYKVWVWLMEFLSVTDTGIDTYAWLRIERDQLPQANMLSKAWKK